MRNKSLDGNDRVILILIFSIIYMPKKIHRLGENVSYPSKCPEKHAHLLGYNVECTINEGMYKNQQICDDRS